MARQGLRSHLSGSVPVSIVAHLVVLLVLVVIPLADIVLPIPAMTMPSYVLAAPLPPPPPYVPRPPSTTTTAPRPDSGSPAPVSAPDTIRPEAPVAPPSIALGSDVDGAVPGFGVVGSVAPPAPPLPAPPDPPKPQGPVRVALLPESPRKTVDVHPIYPEVARAARVEGTVILEAVLDSTGRVTQLKVIRSVPLLDQAAVDAVRQWRYTPSTYGGRPVSVLMTITVRFTLQQ
jgi:periplasmic protein TonB